MTALLPFEGVKQIAVLGTGTIGASWTAYFLSRGFKVSTWDPGEDWQSKLQTFIDTAWPQLESLGLAPDATKAAVSFHDSAAEAVAQADFVQENAPERMDIKKALYGDVEAALPAHCIFSTSTSGLILSDLIADLKTAHRFVVGHPFNPPHLIPLVEVVASNRTSPEVVDWTLGFYNFIGKHAILIKKEVPGHLANRFQAALWREATLAVVNDLASIEDINAAMSQGPGLRLALMGPHMIFNLAGGKGGFQAFYDHFGPAMEKWWESMQGEPALSQELCETIMAGLQEEAGGRTLDDLEAERDRKLLAILKALKETR